MGKTMSPTSVLREPSSGSVEMPRLTGPGGPSQAAPDSTARGKGQLCASVSPDRQVLGRGGGGARFLKPMNDRQRLKGLANVDFMPQSSVILTVSLRVHKPFAKSPTCVLLCLGDSGCLLPEDSE